MSTWPDTKHFVGEALPDGFDVGEVEDDLAKLFECFEQTPCFGARHELHAVGEQLHDDATSKERVVHRVRGEDGRQVAARSRFDLAAHLRATPTGRLENRVVASRVVKIDRSGTVLEKEDATNDTEE